MKPTLNQSGFALLMLVVILMGLTSVALSGILSSSVKQRNAQHNAENRKVLLEAKEALLSYVVNYAKSGTLADMGKLPCPDSNNAIGTEGNQDPNCGIQGVNAYGYFPFKTLGMGKVEDAANECLWYVVSGDYKNDPESDLLNWDTVGYLNLVDENDNLKHGSSENDFPIAFIISPGANLGQDRTPDAALPQCGANYTLASYLEGGPNINYAADLPLTADTIWEILTVSESVQLEDQDYNDQVIAIYRNELWDRIRQLGDLSFDNTPLAGATSTVENLTRSLAECIAAYGSEVANINQLLPYPAPVNLRPLDNDQGEYRSNATYDDAVTQYGRFPQVINEPGSPILHANFVSDTSAAASYCEGAAGVTLYDERFWENWKDHFFYVVSDDFDPASLTPVGAARCGVPQSCFTINGSVINEVAAMVIFAGPAELGQSRIWWWDDGASTATDEKDTQNNYLENGNEIAYDGTAVVNYNMNAAPTDYAYCVVYDVAFNLVVAKCADVL